MKERGFLYKLVERAREQSAFLFHFNAGACNGCDIELVSCLTPRYDVEQYGIKLEGSPRHADVFVVSGPITRSTHAALEVVYKELPDPKVVVAIGNCPATGNVFCGSPMIEGPLDRIMPVDIYIPGCPPRPNAIIDGVAAAIHILAQRRSDRTGEPQ
jgi:membrane-bound hydrogenase subunit mbhJ